MTHKEILNSEKRNNNDYLLIHLYYEGTWWRAYEWSAYLTSFFPSSLTEKEKLTPIKKNSKLNNDGVIMVGFQLKSFDKYLPNIYNSDLIVINEDKHIVINVANFYKNINFENYETLLINWKQSIKKRKDDIQPLNSMDLNTDVINILNELKEYSLATNSLLDTTIFLSNIQKRLIKIRL